MAVEVNGKSFESYSDALDEYINSHLGEKICIPKQRNTDRLETAEVTAVQCVRVCSSLATLLDGPDLSGIEHARYL